MYTVKPLIGTEVPDALGCLASGMCRRWGGVIRRSAGSPGAGQFIKGGFLRDIGEPAYQRLPDALGLANVGAAASVLNLGVSAIGFAVMARKLNRLQRDVTQLLDLATRNHSEVLVALAEIGDRLVELRALSLENRELALDAIEGLAAIRKDLLDAQMARVTTRLELLQRIEGPVGRADATDAFQIFGEARRFAEAGIAPNGRASSAVHDGMMRVRLWSMAAVSDLLLLRRTGEIDHAAVLARQFAIGMRQTASEWRDTLVPPGELGGIGRYAYAPLGDRLAPDVRERLYRMSGTNDSPANQRDMDTRGALLTASHLGARASHDFLEQEIARAQALDFLEEVVERLESLADEMEFTAERRLSFKHWESLPATTSPGLFFIDALEAA